MALVIMVYALICPVLSLCLFRYNKLIKAWDKLVNNNFNPTSDIKNVVISWKELLGRGSDVSVAATFGQQVCSK